MSEPPETRSDLDNTKILYALIGNNIQMIRHQQGMSLAKLGETLGIEELSMANYEAGLEKISPSTLCNIAVVLGTTLGFIFGFSSQDAKDLCQTKALALSSLHKNAPLERF